MHFPATQSALADGSNLEQTLPKPSSIMTQITDLLREIRSAGITIEVTNDSRGVSPGGSMSLDLVRNHRCFATLSIKSFHETNARFENIDTYRITHLTIDNAEPINLRAPKTGQQLWTE